MAWTAPRTFIVGEMVTHTIMNAHWRDQLIVLDNHTHNDASGQGSANIQPFRIGMLDQAGSPSLGTLQRNGNHLEWSDGVTTFVITNADQVAGSATVRTLGTNGTQIANGTHKHFEL